MTVILMKPSLMMMMIMMTTVAAAIECVLAAGVQVEPGSVVCLGSHITEMPPLDPRNTTSLDIKQTYIKRFRSETFTKLTRLRKLWIVENIMLRTIQDFAFADLPELSFIEISQNKALETIGAHAFYNLPTLHEIITNSRSLKSLHHRALGGLAALQYLTISNTGIEIFPDFNRIHSAAHQFLLVLKENTLLSRVPHNAFRGLCTETIKEMRLTGNGFEEVASDAFNGTQMLSLILSGNRRLANIDPNAFAGSGGLVELNVSGTAVRSLPESILAGLNSLWAEDAWQLKTLPPLLTNLRHAALTYHWHCCAFRNMTQSKWGAMCSNPEAKKPVNSKFFHKHCNTSCSPPTDEFDDCDDIMTHTALRVLIWVISVLALLGNAAVLLVLLGSRSKLTVPRFLMCHLAFADLCMGVYLAAIATVDILSRGQYYNQATAWQRGSGCRIAGFFTVFSSELSVFTLTAITLERWHTITHALRLDRKLRLRHACVVMATGWVFSLLAAVLPTVGVSSYSKVSICLPMDVASLQSQVYVVGLLLLNVLAFLTVCVCYLSIYLAVRNPSSTPAHAAADTDVARRMAVLIFTDFLCLAPISFFAISAALKKPLITVSHAKLLLVLFYPINSCANPFLYAFFTRTFRRDFFLLAARFGLFRARAQVYRAESSACHQPAWTTPTSSHGTPGSTAHGGH